MLDCKKFVHNDDKVDKRTLLSVKKQVRLRGGKKVKVEESTEKVIQDTKARLNSLERISQ
jgi:hypothetical protein